MTIWFRKFSCNLYVLLIAQIRLTTTEASSQSSRRRPSASTIQCRAIIVQASPSAPRPTTTAPKTATTTTDTNLLPNAWSKPARPKHIIRHHHTAKLKEPEGRRQQDQWNHLPARRDNRRWKWERLNSRRRWRLRPRRIVLKAFRPSWEIKKKSLRQASCEPRLRCRVHSTGNMWHNPWWPRRYLRSRSGTSWRKVMVQCQATTAAAAAVNGCGYRQTWQMLKRRHSIGVR